MIVYQLCRTSGGGTGEGHHLGGGVSRGERHKGETVVATEVAVTPEVDMVAAFVVFYSDSISHCCCSSGALDGKE